MTHFDFSRWSLPVEYSYKIASSDKSTEIVAGVKIKIAISDLFQSLRDSGLFIDEKPIVAKLVYAVREGLSTVRLSSIRITSQEYGSATISGFKQADRDTLSVSKPYLGQWAISKNTTVTGGIADDTIVAGSGKDLIIGGLGGDRLTGGGGRDIFRYLSINDSLPGKSNRDVITDFKRGQGDRIDLRRIDADPGRKGNQSLSFVTGQSFSGAGGEVIFQSGRLQVDISGDMRPDMEIQLLGVRTFQASSLIM
jgi:Ca2+-binding RTX toxin-like protein